MMETEKKFVEMVCELASIFEIEVVKFSTDDNDMTDGGTLNFYSGLIIQIDYTPAKMDIHYRYKKAHGITERMRNEMKVFKEIFDSCYQSISN